VSSEPSVVEEMDAIDADARYWLARTKEAALTGTSHEVLTERQQHEQAWWNATRPKAPTQPTT
jgi:hypothetical protein